MTDQRKCECGHTNPIGTLLCESCGKPVEGDNEQNSFPSMRYEGMARRSKTHTKSVIDWIWNFFSSVKIAVVLILITLIASAVGTIFPQERYIPVPVPTESAVAAFYEDTYGILGQIYYLLGFHNLYSSWWFITLLVMIGMSLVICSLDRIVPLYKALNKPRVNPHLSFLQGQRLHGESEAAISSPDETLEQAAGVLRKKGYRIYREGTSLLGEKARFSRWGPYINHIGLILFLLGVLLRGLPGMYLDEFVWVREGQTVPVPETPYYIKNVEYKTEYYEEHEFPEQVDLDGGVVAKNFQTDAILYLNQNADLPGAEPKLKEVKSGPITVNHPFVYEDLYLYQASKQEMQLKALNFTVVDKQAGNKQLGQLKLDLYAPDTEQTIADDVTVRVIDYFPDFYLDESGEPATLSPTPNNPMFAVEVKSMTDGTAEKLIYVSGRIIPEKENGRYTLEIKMPDFTDITGLMVRKDKMLPLIYFGSFVVMVGLVMGFYWQHRRIWVHVEQGCLYVAGHTNKNWFGLQREAEFLIDQLSLPVSLVLESKEKKKASGKRTKQQVRQT
ncbi:cytochrome c biogenesis protein ResB [Brevibacillus humidisoli]|uniref:cytochrome c biogenesis protein ResB n=1 Tax=Brevibacillus humidisoli TaxID=2895522 RepID=UPI001E3EB1F4|nr:cytochrome c biogenesis protein ResB [Brevibacillus humidisoli]UFJ42833.1 cytochrome c biogenesis protein ResB [Brevibacillus humidisoli]